MAQTEPTNGVNYYRNYNENDSAYILVSPATSSVVLNYDHPCLNFSVPEGKAFKEWNSARNGSGISYSIGASSLPSSLYAIWREAPIIYYATETELTNIADAIRTKTGTSEALEWPNGFISTIEAITKYGITDQGGGKVSIDKNSAYQGETITITANTRAYVTAYYNNGSVVFILKETINANETATFIMPAHNTIVMATIPKY